MLAYGAYSTSFHVPCIPFISAIMRHWPHDMMVWNPCQKSLKYEISMVSSVECFNLGKSKYPTAILTHSVIICITSKQRYKALTTYPYDMPNVTHSHRWLGWPQKVTHNFQSFRIACYYVPECATKCQEWVAK